MMRGFEREGALRLPRCCLYALSMVHVFAAADDDDDDYLFISLSLFAILFMLALARSVDQVHCDVCACWRRETCFRLNEISHQCGMMLCTVNKQQPIRSNNVHIIHSCYVFIYLDADSCMASRLLFI